MQDITSRTQYENYNTWGGLRSLLSKSLVEASSPGKGLKRWWHKLARLHLSAECFAT